MSSSRPASWESVNSTRCGYPTMIFLPGWNRYPAMYMRHGVFCARNVSSSARWESKQWSPTCTARNTKPQPPAVNKRQVFPSSALVSTVPPPPPSPISTAGTAAPSLRTTFGCTPTMKAELLWCLNTVTRHQSFKSNEGIGDLFRAMYPDSEVAHSFACGPDKTAYITKFGIAPYIFEQLVASSYISSFVFYQIVTTMWQTKDSIFL